MRNQMNNMEKLLPLFQQRCESEASSQSRKAVVAADETFFGDFLILVLMDLSSGYLILEDISDRAKALIKIAITGFDCQSGADTFHAQYDVSKWLGAKLVLSHSFNVG
jgi:hypothetical protein